MSCLLLTKMKFSLLFECSFKKVISAFLGTKWDLCCGGINVCVSSTGIEYDYFGIGEFWGCKSLFNDFGMQFRFFAYQRASLTGGVAVKAGQSVLSIMTVNTSDNQEFPKLRLFLKKN